MPEIARIPVSLITSVGEGSVASLPEADAIMLVTPSGQWAYGAEAVFEIPGIENEPRILKIALEVQTGVLGVGWLAEKKSDWVTRASASQATGERELSLFIPAHTSGGKLIFHNWTVGGPARAVVRRIRILESIEEILNKLKDFDNLQELDNDQFAHCLFHASQDLVPRIIDSEYSFTSYYQKNRHDLLAVLCDKYGSDKGEVRSDGHPYSWPSHSYTDFYSRLFCHCRRKILKVFECGLGTTNPNLPSSMGIMGKPGASLRVWRDFFPNALVIGADIDKSILFEEERINTYYIDQLDAKAISRFWEQVGLDNFDLMIDDGLHTFESAVLLFEHSIDKLGTAGIYIIEDVDLRSLLQYKRYFDDILILSNAYTVEYVVMSRPKLAVGNNILIVIRRQ